MTRLEAIKNRTLSQHNQAVIHGLAGKQSEEGIEDQMPAPTVEDPRRAGEEPQPANGYNINDVEFYGPRVLEFYGYFEKEASQANAATLALAAATLKASVVLGGLIKDLTEAIKPAGATIPAIPVKTIAPAIPGKRKRGRPRKNL